MNRIVGGDNFGEGYGTGNWGVWVFVVLIVFVLVLLALIWRRHDGEGGFEKLLPLVGLLGTKRHDGCHDEHRVTEILKDQARDTGCIINAVNENMGKVQHSLGEQSRYLEKGIEGVLISQKDAEINKLLAALAEEKNSKLHQETRNDMCRGHGEILHALGHTKADLDNRLTHLEDRVVKVPRFNPFGSFSFESCGPRGELAGCHA